MTLAGSDELDMDIISANDNVLVVDRDMMGENKRMSVKLHFLLPVLRQRLLQMPIQLRRLRL